METVRIVFLSDISLLKFLMRSLMVILSPFNPLTMKAQQVAAAFNDLLEGNVVEDFVRIVKLGPIYLLFLQRTF